MNKGLVIILICWVTVLGVAAQNDIRHFRNDRIHLRSSPTTPNPDWAPFFHGVASGDPLEDRLIIWTRVTPDELSGETDIEVLWQLSDEPSMQNIVRSGTVITNAQRDYTVKVDVTELEAGKTYYYNFKALDRYSLIGKTKTTPVGEAVDHLRFGVVSCSNFPAGYFNAYHQLAQRRDLDAVLHLGDYIYEYGNRNQDDSTANNRTVEPDGEILTLEDYRTRYSTYRLDTNLIRIHQQHPFIMVWDDHESANDSYKDGAQNHDDLTEGDWETRKAISKKAYFEWMPIRDNETMRVYRSIRYGELVDLIMLDTRLEGREKQVLDFFAPELQDSTRTLLGAEQKAWFLEALSNSTAKWKIVGQQIIFSEFNIGFASLIDTSVTFGETEGAAHDIWDGYPIERQEIMKFIEDNAIDNIVILTGDFHTSFAFDVASQPSNLDFQDLPFLGETPVYSPSETYDPVTGEGSIAVEFVTPSVTSANFDESLGRETVESLQSQLNNEIDVFGLLNLGNPNPHLKLVNLIDHGFFILDVKPDSTQANWYYTPIDTISDELVEGEAYYTIDAENHLRKAANHSADKERLDEPAPNDPPNITSITGSADDVFHLLSVFPNPAKEWNRINYAIQEPGRVKISLLDASGKQLQTLLEERLGKGLYTLQVSTAQLSKGIYYYRLQAGQQQKIVKLVVQ